MQEVRKSGNRLVIFETVNEVPNFENLILDPDSNITFINSATLNPKSENAELYSHFASDTYRSFLYSFAYQIQHINPASVVSPQLEMNARRFERLCKKRNIVLAEQESLIIKYCQSFHGIMRRYDERVIFSNSLISDLMELYS